MSTESSTESSDARAADDVDFGGSDEGDGGERGVGVYGEDDNGAGAAEPGDVAMADVEGPGQESLRNNSLEEFRNLKRTLAREFELLLRVSDVDNDGSFDISEVKVMLRTLREQAHFMPPDSAKTSAAAEQDGVVGEEERGSLPALDTIAGQMLNFMVILFSFAFAYKYGKGGRDAILKKTDDINQMRARGAQVTGEEMGAAFVEAGRVTVSEFLEVLDLHAVVFSTPSVAAETPRPRNLKDGEGGELYFWYSDGRYHTYEEPEHASRGLPLESDDCVHVYQRVRNSLLNSIFEADKDEFSAIFGAADEDDDGYISGSSALRWLSRQLGARREQRYPVEPTWAVAGRNYDVCSGRVPASCVNMAACFCFVAHCRCCRRGQTAKAFVSEARVAAAGAKSAAVGAAPGASAAVGAGLVEDDDPLPVPMSTEDLLSRGTEGCLDVCCGGGEGRNVALPGVGVIEALDVVQGDSHEVAAVCEGAVAGMRHTGSVSLADRAVSLPTVPGFIEGLRRLSGLMTVPVSFESRPLLMMVPIYFALVCGSSFQFANERFQDGPLRFGVAWASFVIFAGAPFVLPYTRRSLVVFFYGANAGGVRDARDVLREYMVPLALFWLATTQLYLADGVLIVNPWDRFSLVFTIGTGLWFLSASARGLLNIVRLTPAGVAAVRHGVDQLGLRKISVTPRVSQERSRMRSANDLVRSLMHSISERETARRRTFAGLPPWGKARFVGGRLILVAAVLALVVGTSLVETTRSGSFMFNYRSPLADGWWLLQWIPLTVGVVLTVSLLVDSLLEIPRSYRRRGDAFEMLGVTLDPRRATLSGVVSLPVHAPENVVAFLNAREYMLTHYDVVRFRSAQYMLGLLFSFGIFSVTWIVALVSWQRWIFVVFYTVIILFLVALFLIIFVQAVVVNEKAQAHIAQLREARFNAATLWNMGERTARWRAARSGSSVHQAVTESLRSMRPRTDSRNDEVYEVAAANKTLGDTMTLAEGAEVNAASHEALETLDGIIQRLEMKQETEVLSVLGLPATRSALLALRGLVVASIPVAVALFPPALLQQITAIFVPSQ